MKYHVVAAKHLSDYRIWLRFKDGKTGEIDLEKELWGPVFEPLKDKSNFSRFELNDEVHTIEWYNGADIAPEFLYDRSR